eukprot:GHVO01044631.1.p2 GENE.GHVO01044631.1~~GHVO01044631.1.p2  ORF type:complete len:145 (+),score=32.12 GHVO01044631.1:63-497(+)
MSTSSRPLYDLLNVPHDATHAEIKKAYRLLALKMHPDKNIGDEGAADRFASLQKAYEILGDGKKRSQYDKHGLSEDDAFDDAYDTYRLLFPQVTVDDIEAFEKRYKGSDDEKDDVRQFYAKCGLCVGCWKCLLPSGSKETYPSC